MTGQHKGQDPIAEPFAASRTRFEELVDFVGADPAAELDHAALEEQLVSRGRELLRQLYQDHLDLRATREVRLRAVSDADAVPHRLVEINHDRTLATIFGDDAPRKTVRSCLSAASTAAPPSPGATGPSHKPAFDNHSDAARPSRSYCCQAALRYSR